MPRRKVRLGGCGLLAGLYLLGAAVMGHAAEYAFPDPAMAKLPINRIEVSLSNQEAYFYSNGVRVGWCEISTGRKGHETPPGQYTVTDKEVDHHSNLYNNAAMPYFLRLTDDGLGMHAGELPGYRASHGCIRMPYRAALHVYQLVEIGTPVEIDP